MKALRTLLAFLLAAALLTVPALAIDLEAGTGSEFYCRDAAGVLSSETEQLLTAYNDVLENQCDGAQLVVATVNYLSQDADLAAAELMSDWGVGSASQSNGMLLLLVAGEYRGWLTVGDGLDEVFDDDTASLYLDRYFWDDVDADRFDEAVQTLAENLYDWYLDYYGVSDYEQQAPSPSGGSGIVAVFAVIFLLLIFIVLIWVIGAASRFTRMRSWGYTGGFFPIFWFGGGRRYRSYRDQFRPPPPPGPGPGGPAGFGGPGGFMGGGFPGPRQNSSFSRPRGSGFGGRPGGGAGRSGGFGGGSRGGFGGGTRGGGFGGHSGGGGAGRR